MSAPSPGEGRYYRLFESAPDAILILDFESGRVLDVNPYLTRWLGYAHDEVVGRVFWSVGAWGDPNEGPAILRELQTAGSVAYDIVPLRSKSGETFATSIYGNVYLENDIPVIQLNIRDVTARVRAEQALQESEQRFRVFSETATDYAFIFSNREGLVVHWNCGAEALFGYSEQEVLDKPAALIFTPDEQRQGVPVLEIEQALKFGRASDERWHVRKDGSMFWAMGVMYAMKDAAGRHIGFAKIVRDMTEQKIAEETLAKKADELAQSNADLQQFAYFTSHDLQEPLRTMTSYAYLLQDRYGAQLDQDAKDFLGFITAAANRMQALVRDLLIYSRAVAGEKPAPSEVEMEAVVAWALMNLQVAIDDSGAVVTRDALPTVQGNHVQLVQLMQNLISNAIKYHRDEPVRIHISAQLNGDEWMLSVRDNGIGIPSEYQQRIFGLFKRLHGREVPGTGLGLALSKRIVENHGGRIWVESAPGEGSTFYFTLPA